MRFSNNISSRGVNATAPDVFLGTFFSGNRNPAAGVCNDIALPGTTWMTADEQMQTGRDQFARMKSSHNDQIRLGIIEFSKNNRIRPHSSRYTQNKVLLSVPCGCAREELFFRKSGYAREELFPHRPVVLVAGLDFSLQQRNPTKNNRIRQTTKVFDRFVQDTLKTRYF